jgi:uncharacterized heparinase superfamily protein
VFDYSVNRLTRVLQKPPRVIVHRMLSELTAQTDRLRASRRERALDEDALAERTDATDLKELWERVSRRVHAVPVRHISEAQYNRVCPGDADRIFDAAERAVEHRIDLLGTGPIDLGSPIAWHTDFKTGKVWPLAYMRDIDYTNLDCPSDVKVPWEVSRVQWLIPVGQAYLLTGDERYAAAVRAVLDDWMAANPYAHGVNWACTMEVAMRLFSWTWLFQVFHKSHAWSDEAFQARFLRVLFLHGEFTERYLERSDINGNHFTADAAALVCAGLFFGRGEDPERWADEGWRLLCAELPRQVTPDGVDFEGSTAYHRLVLELFFMAARFREACGLDIPDEYKERVIAMARFALAYSRPDGTTPLVGDADDARVLPFGGQAIGDHRYLSGLIGAHWHVADLVEGFDGPLSDIFWTLGSRQAASLRFAHRPAGSVRSAAFPHGGYYVMRNSRDHVFIDCGPVGQGGRGGHGHNDCLSFEATLDGVPLVSDCGAYVYTASAHERNEFRSTAYHNTPQVDEEELNRFTGPRDLWTLRNDAIPKVLRWETGTDRDLFVGTHSGYARLDGAIHPVRTIVLDHARHSMWITDEISGSGDHEITIPLQLAVGVDVRSDGRGRLVLIAGEREFLLEWANAADWSCEIGSGRISPSYGVVVPAMKLLWRRSGSAPAVLTMCLTPFEHA